MGLHYHHRVSGVLTSFACAFFGSYAAISLCELLRTNKTMKLEDPRSFSLNAIFLISISLTGVGIWCMHFIGMGSFVLEDGSREIVLDYSLSLTLLSLFAVLVMGMAGVFVASQDCVFSKTKAEIVEMFIADAKSTLSMRDIKNMKPSQMIWIIATNRLQHLIIGGFFTGTGVCVMHYIGMLAVARNDIMMTYDTGIVAASVLIAIIASIAAFWILFRFLSLYPYKESLRFLCATIMAVAVCGMHYTGMKAVTFHLRDANIRSGPVFTDRKMTEKGALAGGILILLFILMYSLYKQRFIIRELAMASGKSIKASSGSFAEAIADQNQSQPLPLLTTGSTPKSAARISISSLIPKPGYISIHAETSLHSTATTAATVTTSTIGGEEKGTNVSSRVMEYLISENSNNEDIASETNRNSHVC